MQTKETGETPWGEVLEAEGGLTEPARTDRAPSRRDLIFGSALFAALAAGCPSSSAPRVLQPPPNNPNNPDPPAAPPEETLRRLVERITFGANAHELHLASSLGYQAYLEYHLNYAAIDDSELDAWLAPFPFLNMTAPEFRQYESSGYYRNKAFVASTIVRSLYSKRQLHQRMVEFWTDHFNIHLYESWQDSLKMVDDREVIRRHALGTFPDMLIASAHSPAMLAYLDNDPSSNQAPNENYARELMELHVLGVDQFTQLDVENVAKCFTGWSVDYSSSSPAFLRFVFREDKHDYGAKRVLGHDIPAGGGQEDGETVLQIFTTDPQIKPIVARFIGRKIASKFWGDNPPASLVTRVADAYLATNGDIKAMVRAALSPDYLTLSPFKLKRPYHLIVSSLRALEAWVDLESGIGFIGDTLRLMGHEPYDWAPPNGYPDASGFWASLLLPRWRYGANMVLEDERFHLSLDTYFASADPAEAVEVINGQLFGGVMTDTDRAELVLYLESNPVALTRRLETLGLAIASPGFQWY